MDLQARSVEPLLTMKHERIPRTSLKNPDQQVRSVKRPPANTNIKTPSRPVISVVAQGQTPKEPSRAAAIVNNPSVEKAEPQPVGSLPATPPHLEAPIAPVILALNPPTVDPKKIEGSTPPANHPAIPAKTTGAVAILADPYPSLRIPDRGVSKKQRQATSLQLGRLLSRVEPIYPEEAKQQGIQGTVKLHAIIGRQGSVEKLESVDGSPVLLAAAVKAVRQWRFTETLLAGQSVENRGRHCHHFPAFESDTTHELTQYAQRAWRNGKKTMGRPQFLTTGSWTKEQRTLRVFSTRSDHRATSVTALMD